MSINISEQHQLGVPLMSPHGQASPQTQQLQQQQHHLQQQQQHQQHQHQQHQQAIQNEVRWIMFRHSTSANFLQGLSSL